MSANQSQQVASKIPWPSPDASLKIHKKSIAIRKNDPMPIEWYFFLPSVRGEVCIINDGENMEIYRNKDEHSSRIVDYWRVDNVILIQTENTLHVVTGDTPIRNVAPGEIEHSEDDDFGDDL